MLNIAVIGCGMVAGYGHLPAIARSNRWHLRAVVEPDDPRRAVVTAEHEPDLAFGSADELWDVPELDAVVVATHLESHHGLVLAALERGLHVLCEKPMASSREQCEQMVAAADAADRLLAVNFNTRSQPAYRMIAQVLAGGALGPIHVARFVYNWSCHQWRPPQRVERFMANGGPIVDSGAHFFDGVRLFTGQEISVSTAVGVTLPPYEHPAHVIASCQLSGGSIALVETGWLLTRNTQQTDAVYRVELIGEHGAVLADLIRSTLQVHTRTGSEHHTINEPDKGFDWLYSQWARSIAEGRLCGLASGRDGLHATAAALTALSSAEKRGVGE